MQPENKRPAVDIIIPCLNESLHLGRTFQAIADHLAPFSGTAYNVLLVDNGSTDGSQELARQWGVKVHEKEGCNVSELRNFGAGQLTGDYLAFLDADIEISAEWAKRMAEFVCTTPPDALIVTGAPCERPARASWVERHWFNGKGFSEQAYVNSGNLISTRTLFRKIGGFNSALTTGEDWDFCYRAKKSGGRLQIDRRFKVFHHGFPKTIRSFYARETWHGRGDAQNLESFMRSKPALVSTVCGVLLSVWVVALLWAPSAWALASYPALLLAVSAFMAKKRSSDVRRLPGNILLAMVYLAARFKAVAASVLIRKARRS
jgi:glycosyltransferase involved in cell wall biosynthesis